MIRTDIPSPAFEKKVPEGDDRLRSVCIKCNFVDYQNPKIVVGSIATAGSKILLCKRAIDPRKGYWTIPAGYMELNETVEAGAMREAEEEAGAKLKIDQQLAIYSVPHISQVQIIFRAQLLNPDTIKAGIESLDVGLFEWADIPWDDLAFPSAVWALRQWRATKDEPMFIPFGNPVNGL